jgi:hypothetical protein
MPRSIQAISARVTQVAAAGADSASVASSRRALVRSRTTICVVLVTGISILTLFFLDFPRRAMFLTVDPPERLEQRNQLQNLRQTDARAGFRGNLRKTETR